MYRTSLLLLAAVLLGSAPASGASPDDWACPPTPPDAQGPFYRADTPIRYRLGTGYRLTGTVRSASDCRPLPGARVEVWMTGPDGRYADRWRATLIASRSGRYRLESSFPGPYGSRPPHIHLIANAPGHAELVTQFYPGPAPTRAASTWS